ncbi:MAG TPA: beta-propeller domain-containing protein [Microthrixaceae bacterium]|nr:beta-propeller domain-containing protein [Microthrixaceae bacterium]
MDQVRPAIAARASALADMEQRGDMYKTERASGPEQPMAADGNSSTAGAPSSDSSTGAASSAEAGSGDAGSASDRVVGTNVQEVGVDEADFVKADSERIVTITNGVLRTIALDGTPQIDGTLKLPDTQSIAEMYLLGKEALVLDSLYTAPFDTVTRAGAGDGWDSPVAKPEAGAVAGDIAMAGHGSATRLTRVDLSDLSTPKIVQSIVVEGSLTASRAIDSTVRIVLRGDALPNAQIYGASTPSDLRGIAENLDGEELLPKVIDDSGKVRPVGACGDVMVQAESTISDSLPVNVTVLSVNGTLDDLHPVTVQGPAETVYASTDALVVAGSGWSQAGPFTTLHRFDLSTGDKALATGSGVVAGSLLNQFALSERSGALRVVTTVEDSSGGTQDRTGASASGTSSSLVILDSGSPDLAQMSRVDGLGPGETVQSVRFLDSIAYVVTFRQTDPLYAIDLSDPKAPRNLGELKVTGFSQYMHPVGEGLLIGVGREVDPATGTDLGLKISLFDVSNPVAMTEVDRIVVPDAYSPAGDDHRAFTWDSVNNHAIFPVESSCPSVAPVEPMPMDPMPTEPMPTEPVTIEPAPGTVSPSEPGRAVAPEPTRCTTLSAALVVGVSNNKLARVAELSHQPGGSWAGLPKRSLIVGEDLWTISDLGVGRSSAAEPRTVELTAF